MPRPNFKATWCAMQGSNLRLVAAATALEREHSSLAIELVRDAGFEPATSCV